MQRKRKAIKGQRKGIIRSMLQVRSTWTHRTGLQSGRVYNYADEDHQPIEDPSYDWFNDQSDDWWHQDYDEWYDHQGYFEHHYEEQPQQLALPAPPQQEGDHPINQMQSLHIAAILSINKLDQRLKDIDHSTQGIMIDSGAATHVCPPWFGTSFPLHQMSNASKPNLKTVTDDDIYVYGYRWIHVVNQNGQQLVIPFFVCDVKSPILSVTRLVSQGFEVNLKQHPTITNTGFHSDLVQQDGLFYVHLTPTDLPAGHQPVIARNADGNQQAMIAPIGIGGPVTHNNDIWTMNNQGYLVRIHKRLRKALFMPSSKGCPIPVEQLEDYRKTIIRQAGQQERILEEQYQQLSKSDQLKVIEGSSWIGETWFKPKPGASPEVHQKQTPLQLKHEHQGTKIKSRIFTEQKGFGQQQKTSGEQTSEDIKKDVKI